MEQEYSLRWNNYESHLCLVLGSMFKKGILVDVTLFAEGTAHKVHRTVLSACSPYFEDIFAATSHSHPVIVLKDVTSEDLTALIDYMYTGQVTVSRSKLPGFLKVAEGLKIRGLANSLQYQETLYCDNKCTPSSNRKRKMSIENEDEDLLKNNFNDQNFPTDLSIPKAEFQPVTAIGDTIPAPSNVGEVPKVNVKPREFLMSSPSEDSEFSVDRGKNKDPCSQGHTSDVLTKQPDRQSFLLKTVGRADHGGGQFYKTYSDDQSDGEDRGFTFNEMAENHDGMSGMVRSGICNVCGCFRSDLRQHMDSHSGQKFDCHFCGRSYPRRKTLNQHVKRSHQGLVSADSATSNNYNVGLNRPPDRVVIA